MKSALRRASVLALAVFLLVPAALQANSKTGECATDAKNLCPGMTWGQGLGDCLKEHSSELSSQCQQRVANAQEMGHQFKEACQNDIKQLCTDVQAGHGKIMQCLKDNMAKLSSDCQSQLKMMEQKHSAG